MKRYLNILLVLGLMVGGVSCQSEQAHEHEAETATAETTYTCPMHPQVVQSEPGDCPICGMKLVPVSQSGKESGQLMLSDNQIALGNIQVRPVQLGDVAGNTLLTGKLVLDENETDVVSSRAAGRVEQLYVKETGERIRKGQPLYALYSEELLTLQREYLLALRQQQELGREHPRFASLLQAAKQKLLLYGLTPGQVSSLGKSGQPDARVTFVAPAAGVVTDISVAEGQYVTEGSVLYRLSKLKSIWVEAELYPQEIAKVQEGDLVQVKVQGFAEAVPAKVSFISPEFQQGSQVALLRAELPNPQGQYLPGMQASVLLPDQQSTALLVPTDAVIRTADGNHVWVQTGKNSFQARMVTLGDESAENVAVLNGLHPRDKVVTSGAYLLYSEFVLKKGNPMAGMDM